MDADDQSNHPDCCSVGEVDSDCRRLSGWVADAGTMPIGIHAIAARPC